MASGLNNPNTVRCDQRDLSRAHSALQKARNDANKYLRSIDFAEKVIARLRQLDLPIPMVSHRVFEMMSRHGEWSFDPFVELRWDDVHMLELREETILGSIGDDLSLATDKEVQEARMEVVLKYVSRSVIPHRPVHPNAEEE